MGKICLTAMNDICQDLTFTVETVHDFSNRKLATLDFQCEVISNQISYTYFQKSMKTPLVLGAMSAMSEHQRISILSNEVIRRMSNMSEDISQEERTLTVDRFTKELKNSGYTRPKAREIVVCGLLGLERKRKRRVRDGEAFHRRANTTLAKRTAEKLHGKQSWYKTKPRDKAEEIEKSKEDRERIREDDGDILEMKTVTSTRKAQTDPKAVVFVPYTPNSTLAKELRKIEETMMMLTGTRMKIVEKAGRQLKQLLVNSNPWAGQDCSREECLICQTREEMGEGKGKTCWRRNLLYETWCETCQLRDEKTAEEAEEDTKSIKLYKYIGESSRSGFLRGKNHLDDARLLSTSSHMLKHFILKHQDDRPEEMIFRMKVICFKKSAYERQVHESILIQQNRHHHLLNSKSEYNRCSLPRLTVKVGEREMEEVVRKSKEEQQTEDELERQIKHWKKQSKKRSIGEPDSQPRNKRQKLENNCSNYCGSIEHLLCGHRDTFDRNVDIAIEEAIRMCDVPIIEMERECDEQKMTEIDNCGDCKEERVHSCGDDRDCGDETEMDNTDRDEVRDRGEVVTDYGDDNERVVTDYGDERVVTDCESGLIPDCEPRLMPDRVQRLMPHCREEPTYLMDASGHVVTDCGDASGQEVTDCGDASRHVVTDCEDASGHVITDCGDASGHVVTDRGDASGHVVTDCGDASGHVVTNCGGAPRHVVTDCGDERVIVSHARPGKLHGLQAAVKDDTGKKHTPITSFLVPQTPKERMSSSIRLQKQRNKTKALKNVEDMSASPASPILRRRIVKDTGAAGVQKTSQEDTSDTSKTSTIKKFFHSVGEGRDMKNKSTSSNNNNRQYNSAETHTGTSLGQQRDTPIEESSQQIGQQPIDHVISKSAYLPMRIENENQPGIARKSSHFGPENASE